MSSVGSPGVVNLAWAMPIDVAVLCGRIEAYAAAKATMHNFDLYMQSTSKSLPQEFLRSVDQHVQDELFKTGYIQKWHPMQSCAQLTCMYGHISSEELEVAKAKWNCGPDDESRQSLNSIDIRGKAFNSYLSWIHQHNIPEHERNVVRYGQHLRGRCPEFNKCRRIFHEDFGLKTQFLSLILHEPANIRRFHAHGHCRESHAFLVKGLDSFTIENIGDDQTVQYSILGALDLSRMRPLTDAKRKPFTDAVKRLRLTIPDLKMARHDNHWLSKPQLWEGPLATGAAAQQIEASYEKAKKWPRLMLLGSGDFEGPELRWSYDGPSSEASESSVSDGSEE